MLSDLFAILWAPFLMCLVLTGIHAYLGVHVLAREVVFVDIAMAQIAALGATVAFLLGHDIDAWESYAYSLAATLVGALVLAITRSRRRNVSQEAVIGIVYAVSSAAAVLVAAAGLDLPTGAAVVGAFGATLIVFWIATRFSRRLAALGAGREVLAKQPR